MDMDKDKDKLPAKMEVDRPTQAQAPATVDLTMDTEEDSPPPAETTQESKFKILSDISHFQQACHNLEPKQEQEQDAELEPVSPPPADLDLDSTIGASSSFDDCKGTFTLYVTQLNDDECLLQRLCTCPCPRRSWSALRRASAARRR